MNYKSKLKNKILKFKNLFKKLKNNKNKFLFNKIKSMNKINNLMIN